MNLLFIMGHTHPDDDANSIIIGRLLEKLSELYPNLDVTQLGLTSEVNKDFVFNCGNITIRKVVRPIHLRFSKPLKDFLQNTTAVTRTKKMGLYLRRPWLLIEYVLVRMFSGGISRQYRREIEKLCDKEKFDVIVCVSYPFEGCIATAKSHISIPYIFYQLDPYFGHYRQKFIFLAQLKEAFVCRRANHIIMTKLIYQDYSRTALQKYLYKSSVLEFPSIRIRNYEGNKSVSRIESKKLGMMHFLFLGSIYSDIRSPEFCYNLFKQIIKVNSNIVIRIVGPLYGVLSSETKNAERALGNHLVLQEPVNSETAERLLNEADFLINIGNTIHNQMPSKLIEYISTGKPIINIYKFPECPTLPYTAKYPLCLNISESRIIDNALVCEVLDFCMHSYGKMVTGDELQKRFISSTVDYVCDRFMRIVDNIAN